MSQRSILRQIIEEFCEVVTRDVARLNRDLERINAKEDATTTKRMTPDEAEKHFQLVRILRMGREGILSMKEIAAEEGVSVSSVQGILADEFRARRTEEKGLRIERYRRLRAQGVPFEKIAEMDGISRQAVQRMLSESSGQ